MIRSARILLLAVLILAVLVPAAAADPGPTSGTTLKYFLPLIRSELAPLTRPNGLAVNPNTHRVYATSRNTDRVFALDGTTLAVLGAADVGVLPWGVAVNPTSGKLYVANFGSGSVSVVDAETLEPLKTISVGGYPTFVRVNSVLNKVYVVSYASNKLTVINGATDTVDASVSTGGSGAWGLAYNSVLNRVYVSHRDTRNITTLDGNNAFQVVTLQNVVPCGSGSPYGMDFNADGVGDRKLYVACAPSGNVNVARVYLARATGLTPVTSLSIGQGGSNGGGGVAVDTATGNAFFTNSVDDTVSVIDGILDTVVATVSVGDDPFGIAVDPTTLKVYAGNRTGDSISAFTDSY